MITSSEAGFNIADFNNPNIPINKQYMLLRKNPPFKVHDDGYVIGDTPFGVDTDGDIIVRFVDKSIQIMSFEPDDSDATFIVESMGSALDGLVVKSVSVRWANSYWYFALSVLNNADNLYYLYVARSAAPTSLTFTISLTGSDQPISHVAWSQYGTGLFYVQEVRQNSVLIKSYDVKFCTPDFSGSSSNQTNLNCASMYPVYGFDCAGKDSKDILLINARAPALHTYSSSIDYSPTIITEPNEIIYTREITYQSGIPFCSDKYEVEHVNKASATNYRRGARVTAFPATLPAADTLLVASTIGSDSEVNADGTVTAFSGLYFYFSGDGKYWSQRQMFFYSNVENYTGGLPETAKFIVRGQYIYLFQSGVTLKARITTLFGGIHEYEKIDITNYVSDYSNSFGETRQSSFSINNIDHSIWRALRIRDGAWMLLVQISTFTNNWINWTLEEVDDFSVNIEGAPNRIQMTSRNKMALLTDQVTAIDNIQFDTTLASRDNYSGLLATKDNGGLAHTVSLAGQWESKNYRLYLKNNHEEGIAFSSAKSDIENGFVSAILASPGLYETGGSRYVGIVFRAIDKNNYWYAILHQEASLPFGQLRIGYCRNGVKTTVYSVTYSGTGAPVFQAPFLHAKPFVMAVDFHDAHIRVYAGYVIPFTNVEQDYVTALDQNGHRIGYTLAEYVDYVIPGYTSSNEPMARGYVGIIGSGGNYETSQVLPYTAEVDFINTVGNSMGWRIIQFLDGSSGGYYDWNGFTNVNPANPSSYTDWVAIDHNIFYFNMNWTSIQIFGQGLYARVETRDGLGSSIDASVPGSADVYFDGFGGCLITNPFSAPYKAGANTDLRILVRKDGSNVARIDKIVFNSNGAFNPFEKPWQHTFDFSVSTQGFTIVDSTGTYVSGTGWDEAVIERTFYQPFKVAYIDIEIESVTTQPDAVPFEYGYNVYGLRYAQLYSHVGNIWKYRARADVYVAADIPYYYTNTFKFTGSLRKVTLKGVGRDIFDENQLLEHDVLEIKPNQTTVTTFATVKDKDYRVIAEGVFYYPLTLYTLNKVDAQWLYPDRQRLYKRNNELLLNDATYQDGAYYNSFHAYHTKIKGTGGAFSFTYPSNTDIYASTFVFNTSANDITKDPSIRVEVYPADSTLNQITTACYQLEVHDNQAPLTIENLMKRYGSYAGITRFAFDSEAVDYSNWTLTPLYGLLGFSNDNLTIASNGDLFGFAGYCMYNENMPQTYSFTVELGDSARYSVFVNSVTNPRLNSYELRNNTDGSIEIRKWINNVSTLLYHVQPDIAYPAGKLQIAVHQRPGTTSTQAKTISIGMWLNDRLLVCVVDDGVDVEGRRIGLGIEANFYANVPFVVYGAPRVPNMNDVLEWSTLDPSEQPIAGIRRAIEDRLIKFFVRFNGALRALKPVQKSSIYTVDDNYVLSKQFHIDNRQVVTHLRFRGPFHWVRIVDEYLHQRFGHRFAQIDNTSMMTLEDCLREARRTFKRIKEQVYTASFTSKSLALLEPEDPILSKNDNFYTDQSQYIIEDIQFKDESSSFSTQVNMRQYFDE